MRAFKHISPSENDAINRIFPHMHDYGWEETSDYIPFAVSLWSQWAHEITENVDELLWNVSPEVDVRRTQSMLNLSKALVRTFETHRYLPQRRRFKKLVAPELLVQDIEHHQGLRGMILLPEIRTIYFEGHDYTAWFFIEGGQVPALLTDLVDHCGLKFIGR